MGLGGDILLWFINRRGDIVWSSEEDEDVEGSPTEKVAVAAEQLDGIVAHATWRRGGHELPAGLCDNVLNEYSENDGVYLSGYNYTVQQLEEIVAFIRTMPPCILTTEHSKDGNGDEVVYGNDGSVSIGCQEATHEELLRIHRLSKRVRRRDAARR